MKPLALFFIICGACLGIPNVVTHQSYGDILKEIRAESWEEYEPDSPIAEMREVA